MAACGGVVVDGDRPADRCGSCGGSRLNQSIACNASIATDDDVIGDVQTGVDQEAGAAVEGDVTTAEGICISQAEDATRDRGAAGVGIDAG